MSNSYRIRTSLGVDKSVRVFLDQDFDFLEILSLKLLQNDIYTRPCSDYGVVVGRISVNNGFGIPNAKVSIFIPLTRDDENDPVISDLYPYKTLTSQNDDGYRYNLLPYKQQHGGHTPTGTFFDREDVLTNTSYIEVFDKYYKYTARTNDSGDFMIFGVPLGEQTIHVDIDLSDIGEFSLFPQDLIRMGRASENQVAGTKFKSSSNLGELPQIISINRTIEVEPLWGEEQICSIGITRSDFDLTDGLDLRIEPTAVFMGSIISSNDNLAQKRNCKPRLKQGKLCTMISGPGEILALRQTVFQDTAGRPFIEPYTLEGGGQVIDDNGTWLIDLPMNLDYVVTNEFGEQVLSSDPSKGIPTKAKYRFKVKWNQKPTLREPVKRGYFLVPNIKEYGWTTSNNDDPLLAPQNTSQYKQALSSYAYSVDWNDYGDTGTTIGQQMIQEAIDCEDRFYEFTYNKVYTVSQFIDQYRNGYLTNRIISVKDILDDTCESENTKFPTNDANFRWDIIFLLFMLMMYVFKPILYLLLIVVHILAFFLWLIGPILAIVVGVIFFIVIVICLFIKTIIDTINLLPGVNLQCGVCPCPTIEDLKENVKKMLTLWKFFTKLPLPNLTYPDCELCNCTLGEQAGGSPETNPATSTGYASIAESGINTILSQYPIIGNYNINAAPNVGGVSNPSTIATLLAGQPISKTSPTTNSRVPISQTYGNSGENTIVTWTTSLTLAERINLFNVKAKYFNQSTINTGGGVNRIKVTFNTDDNQPSTKFHYDNMLVISCDKSALSTFQTGQLISFQDFNKSRDINVTGLTTLNQFNTPSTTGTTKQNGYQLPLQYAKFDGSGNQLMNGGFYNIKVDGTEDYHKFPIDVEYFQVITAMTYNNYSSMASTTLTDSLYTRYLNNSMRIEFYNKNDGCHYNTSFINPLSVYTDGGEQVIVFLVRGVDPYSTRNKNRYDLSYIFGYNTEGNVIIEGDYKLNIPIQGKFTPVKHNDFTSDTFSQSTTVNYGGYLYYPSFRYIPSQTGQANFSGFSSNLPSYYSKLDNSYSIPGVTLNISGVGLKVNTPNNAFSKEYSDPNTTISCPYQFNPPFSIPPPTMCTYYRPLSNGSSVVNRGYYNYETVDGGSFMRIVQSPANWYFDDNNPYKCNSPTDQGPFNINFNGDYFSEIYPTTTSFTYNSTLGIDGNQIVMRSDRLPSSTSLSQTAGRTFVLQNNLSFAVYQVSDDGVTSPASLQTQNSSLGGQTDDTPVGFSNPVIESFSCANLVPLSCYDTQNGEISIIPKPNDCYENGVNPQFTTGDGQVMKNGCYITITSIFLSLPRDFELLNEWTTRTQITFAACRNVWSHMFTNNWINGTLYAFPINNDRFFSPPTTSPTNPFCPSFLGGICLTRPNQPYSEYCRKTTFLHPTNTFYYRCTGYDGSNGRFTGAERSQPFIGPPYGGNFKNIMFPTTIIDLGPKTTYIQELVMSDNYDGYVIDKIPTTTFQDIDEILNIFLTSRLVSVTFWQTVIGSNAASIFSYFSRPKNMVDADYAQSISVSSELGTTAFQSESYPPATGQDPIYFNGSNSAGATFGIFFKTDLQLKDWITPKRTIISPTANPTSSCAFNKFGTKSQVVPFYQWNIESSGNIFGNQENDWHTSNTIVGSNGLFSYRYQSLDRLDAQSRYFRPVNAASQSFFNGFIYSVTLSSSGNTFELSASDSTWSQNTPEPPKITVGAPFHFYFGLKKGKTAWDRFAKKWLDLETIEIDG